MLASACDRGRAPSARGSAPRRRRRVGGLRRRSCGSALRDGTRPDAHRLGPRFRRGRVAIRDRRPPADGGANEGAPGRNAGLARGAGRGARDQRRRRRGPRGLVARARRSRVPRRDRRPAGRRARRANRRSPRRVSSRSRRSPGAARGPAEAAYARIQLALGNVEEAEAAFRRSIAAARADGRLSDAVRDGTALVWGLTELAPAVRRRARRARVADRTGRRAIRKDGVAVVLARHSGFGQRRSARRPAELSQRRARLRTARQPADGRPGRRRRRAPVHVHRARRRGRPDPGEAVRQDGSLQGRDDRDQPRRGVDGGAQPRRGLRRRSRARRGPGGRSRRARLPRSAPAPGRGDLRARLRARNARRRRPPTASRSCSRRPSRVRTRWPRAGAAASSAAGRSNAGAPPSRSSCSRNRSRSRAPPVWTKRRCAATSARGARCWRCAGRNPPSRTSWRRRACSFTRSRAFP